MTQYLYLLQCQRYETPVVRERALGNRKCLVQYSSFQAGRDYYDFCRSSEIQSLLISSIVCPDPADLTITYVPLKLQAMPVSPAFKMCQFVQHSAAGLTYVSFCQITLRSILSLPILSFDWLTAGSTQQLVVLRKVSPVGSTGCVFIS